MTDQPIVWTTGDRACVVGHGTAAIVHEHHVVERVTKLYVFSKTRDADITRCHRLSDGWSTGHGYGGTTISPTCQRPKKDDR